MTSDSFPRRRSSLELLMKRRHLLHTVATLPLLSSAFAFLSAPTKVAKANVQRTIRRVRPSDPAWPDAASWAKLRETVEGNLIEVRAMFESCAAEPDGAVCREATQYIKNPYWIGDQVAGTQVSGLLDGWTPAPSAYAIKARNTADVVAGVNFARENNLRLAVKGGGHSYYGTSNAPDSLLIWTRAMNEVTLHDAFVGQGCAGRVAPVSAVSAGAGALWIDLYDQVTTKGGRYVQGGGCMTVGVVGLLLGGGFGSYSKRFGTAAAGLLEAEIVTADGRVRVVNECREPDLFWALKGGGGGTFGVVTRLTLRTHELPKYFGGAGGEIKAQSDAAFEQLIERFIDFYSEKLFNPHWGESVHFQPDNTLEFDMACEGLDSAQVAEIWRPFLDWVKARPQDFTMTSLWTEARDARSQWNPSNHWFKHDPRDGVPRYHVWNRGNEGECGAYFYAYDSVWLPASLLEKSRRKQFTATLFAASRHDMVRFHFGKGMAGAPPEVLADVSRTATNPALLDAFTLAIVADGDETPAFPGFTRPPMDMAKARERARGIGMAAAELRKIAPHSGSYFNEANFFNALWREEFWGKNYSKLRAIKTKYDPDGLLFVHHGVGSEDWSADGFTRLSR
jgi:FAD/FMN-containing dehydrogenase